ncbi:conserved protein of unknown function [Pseudodesulfovibrio profundus]|uniref:Uncharacterized protein n=1 Tax=Pseudodesulfovibrio profundus TaxID=57320 RepID=A0A2C8FBY3_9BACT|nr:hypothetical protein [Pseudodesulfovibrio profundus]SOB59959.1 conserved protein of unknown function [Pseudodesulfovibrio profundus]
MSANTLILGLAAGYHYGDVAPFLRSLERVQFAGTCVLFVSETTRDTERMAAHGAVIIPMERPYDLAHVSYNAYRYYLYLEYLQQAGPFEHVMITDVRDVLFQRDPFAYAWGRGLHCALEDEEMTIGSCPFNSRWVQEHMGEEALAAVSDNTISCSGTTVGDHESMVEYLERMTNRFLPFAGGECMGGFDQGVHNVLIRTDLLPDVTLHENGNPILTLGYYQGEPPLNEAGEVLNDQGEVVHVVHQYDRKPELFRRVREQFAWTKNAD